MTRTDILNLIAASKQPEPVVVELPPADPDDFYVWGEEGPGAVLAVLEARQAEILASGNITPSVIEELAEIQTQVDKE